MSSYLGKHAELYDVFYAHKPYKEEAVFVDRCLKRYSIGPMRRILELASGTGSHALALDKHGYDVIAIDYSEDMLAHARAKAAKSASRVDFRLQDMRNLELSEAPFDAAVCLFDSIGYVTTNESLINVLEGVHRHLRREGLFIFEFWHAAAMLRSYEPVRVRRWQSAHGEILRIAETTLDCIRQLGHVTYSIYELNNNGSYSSLRENQVNRYFLVQEMVAFLSSTGFVPEKWFAGFVENENITEDTWHIVGLARRV